MRVKNCAECDREIPIGEMMFMVYWSVVNMSETRANFICKTCMQNALREPLIPGGRI